MSIKRSISILAAGAAVAILAFFYLPWIPTSVQGQEAVNISGADLANGSQMNPALVNLTAAAAEPLFINRNGDPKLYIIPGAALVALFMALIGYIKPSLHSNTVSLLAYSIPSLFGMVVMVWQYSQINAVAAESGTLAAKESLLVVSYSPGWYATFLALGMLFAVGAILYLESDQKPSVLDEAAKLNKEKRATATMSSVDAYEHTLALLAEANKLIKAKRYYIARELLEKIDHPTATRWLEQLDDLMKRETQQAITPVEPAFRTSELKAVTPLVEAAIEPVSTEPSPDLVLAKLAAAKNLIATKRYKEARRLLAGIDHPTAQRWLEKLDEVQLAA